MRLARPIKPGSADPAMIIMMMVAAEPAMISDYIAASSQHSRWAHSAVCAGQPSRSSVNFKAACHPNLNATSSGR
jgi:hypothetical protein